ncbi:hypothetical protein O6H91_07G084300 [Diphasiastrum complanatum]|uniref:Uncharacterized protein n=1 Tax=Diphasiastrum complanatum TaxID=34168 RepID=A0ACC2D724_DIPCM|nr:hypothetical protein O6H91_07G084300 [Diphasiastrum complanatum]
MGGGDYLHISKDADGLFWEVDNDDDGSFVHVNYSVYPSHQGNGMTSGELNSDSTVATGCCKQVHQPNFQNFNDRCHISPVQDPQLVAKVEEGKLLGNIQNVAENLSTELSKTDFEDFQSDKMAKIPYSATHLQKLLASRNMLYDLHKALDYIHKIIEVVLRDTREMKMILCANRNEASQKNFDEPLHHELHKSASAEIATSASFLSESGVETLTVSNSTHALNLSNGVVSKDLVNNLSAKNQRQKTNIDKARCTQKSTFPTPAKKPKNVADLFFHF